jgi:hypothetical protein
MDKVKGIRLLACYISTHWRHRTVPVVAASSALDVMNHIKQPNKYCDCIDSTRLTYVRFSPLASPLIKYQWRLAVCSMAALRIGHPMAGYPANKSRFVIQCNKVILWCANVTGCMCAGRCLRKEIHLGVVEAVGKYNLFCLLYQLL